MAYSFQRRGNLNKNRIAVYAAVLLIFAVSATILIGGSKDNEKEESSGYIVAKQEEPTKVSGINTIDDVQRQLDKLKSDINIFSTNLTSCFEETASIATELQGCKSDTTLCKADFAKLTANKTVAEQVCLTEKTNLQLSLSDSDTKNSELNKTLVAITQDHNLLEKQYNNLAANSANNICCKAKVDNPKIKFYKIESDKIACSEDSGTLLGC